MDVCSKHVILMLISILVSFPYVFVVVCVELTYILLLTSALHPQCLIEKMFISKHII